MNEGLPASQSLVYRRLRLGGALPQLESSFAIASTLFLLVGCGSPPTPPPTVPESFVAERRGPRVTPEEASELARAIAIMGVPSSTPELDALVESLVTLTPELTLQPILSDAKQPPAPYRIVPGDVLDLVVYGRDEFSHSQRVSADGSLEVFLLGSVPVAGKTTLEAATTIQRGLDASYMKKAAVSLMLKESAVSRIKVHGRVREPGAVDLPTDRRLSVHALLTLVGGLAADADGSRLALIRDDAQGERRCYHFTHRQVLGEHLQGREVWLQPDDQLVVPRLPEIFVYGAVEKPGPYALRVGSTIASILFQAGGLSEDADSRAIQVMSGPDRSRAVMLDSPASAGEVVFVPRRQRVYLVGAGVVKNGPLDLPLSGLTVVQAIAEAGWFSAHAKLAEVEILRYEGGKQVRIAVRVDEILDGDLDEGDYPLQPGDLVFVPESIW